MNDDEHLDSLFRDAVSAIDAGDVAELERLLTAHPELARERLQSPGGWLRDKVGGALDGFFRQPYLLWFVAEDPVRNGKLPGNIAAVARTIIDAARRKGVPSLQEQLDYAVTLVSCSWIARQCGVQLALLDVLLDAGAAADGNPVHLAVCSGSVEAVQVLVEAGAALGTKDSAWDGTPLGWAEHYIEQTKGKDTGSKAYPAIAAYLRARGPEH